MTDALASAPAGPPEGGPHQNEATRTLFAYIYYRLGKSDYLRAEIRKKKLNLDDKTINTFLGNYYRTGKTRPESAPLANAVRDIVWSFLKAHPPPSYLDHMVELAFGPAGGLTAPRVDPATAILRTVPERPAANLGPYKGRYLAYRRSTRADSEAGPHFIRYVVNLSNDPGREGSLKFDLCYRSRDRTKARASTYVTVTGLVVRRQDELYFLAGETERNNLLYIVCPFDLHYSRPDTIKGLIVTANRYRAMIAARIVFQPTSLSEDEALTQIGVYPDETADPATMDALAAVANSTAERYTLIWHD